MQDRLAFRMERTGGRGRPVVNFKIGDQVQVTTRRWDDGFETQFGLRGVLMPEDPCDSRFKWTVEFKKSVNSDPIYYEIFQYDDITTRYYKEDELAPIGGPW